MKVGFLIVFMLFSQPTVEEYDIDEIYEKVDLEYGTLNEDGDPTDCIYRPITLQEGKYGIEISDGPGDLYEINGTDYFIKFTSYYGYAGYGEEGVLIIGQTSYDRKFIKLVD